MKARGIGILALAAVACGFVAWHYLPGARAADPAPKPDVPVTTIQARVQDVPVYLLGLGTVQALNVVQVRAQVTGTLIALPIAEGAEVHKNDIVAEIDPRPYQAALDQATAARQGDQAQIQSAQLDLQRYATLAKSSFAPVQQVDDQRATVNRLTASIAADTAAIETARINLGYCVIRSPIDGRVSLHQLDVGNLVQAASQTNILSITQDRPISIVFTLPEADLAQIHAAQARGPVPVAVLDTITDAPIASGTLLTPNNTIDVATGTIALKATFPNDNDALWPGQFVDTRLQVDTIHQAVTIPIPAVEHGPSGLFVYLVQPDQTVAQTNIKLGYQDDGQAVVTQGLKGGETIVVTGLSRLAPGTKVKATDQSKIAAPEATDGAASPS